MATAPTPSAATTRPTVAIVGAGASGLCLGARLRRTDLADFTLFERADAVGGTWRDNTYPGLYCDVPSRYYSFSFALSPGWSRVFAPGGEIRDYLERVATDEGLRPHLRLRTTVVDAAWDEADSRWVLTLGDGTTERFDVLVTATGVLRDPNVPDIAGLETFAGAMFHSARWDHDVPLDGQRIGVVGTGSTGVQITAALGGRAAHLTQFARTPQWVLPLPNLGYGIAGRLLHRTVPGFDRVARRAWQTVFEQVMSHAAVQPGVRRDVVERLCRAALLRVRDPELRARLTPADDPLCKRLVISSSYHAVVQRDDVDVVSDGIDRVVPEGVVTADGRLHELDVLVLATGFHAQRFMRPMAMTGRDGVTIDELWATGPSGYLTIGQPGMPNLFTLQGPHSPVGNQSLIEIAETQAGYVVAALQTIVEEGVTIAPTRAATDAFNTALRAQMPRTAWVGGCDSWYLDAGGVPTLWPYLAEEHRVRLRELTRADLDVRPVTRREAVLSDRHG